MKGLDSGPQQLKPVWIWLLGERCNCPSLSGQWKEKWQAAGRGWQNVLRRCLRRPAAGVQRDSILTTNETVCTTLRYQFSPGSLLQSHSKGVQYYMKIRALICKYMHEFIHGDYQSVSMGHSALKVLENAYWEKKNILYSRLLIEEMSVTTDESSWIPQAVSLAGSTCFFLLSTLHVKQRCVVTSVWFGPVSTEGVTLPIALVGWSVSACPPHIHLMGRQQSRAPWPPFSCSYNTTTVLPIFLSLNFS